MKHNWEYKKLGEVCKVSPFSGIPQVVEDKSWLLNLDKIQSNNGQVMEYDYLNPDAIDGSVTKFNEQNVLFSKLRPNLNKVVVPERSGYCTTELVPLFPDHNIDRHFLAYYLRNPHFVAFLVDKVGGAKMPRVKMNEFWKALCPVPPKAVQKQIVAELDKLNEMIAIRKEQLKELDNLALSLFYDTFGDPIANPKGWSISKLKNLTSLITNGTTPKGGQAVYVDSGVIFFRSQNVWRNKIIMDDIAYLDESTNAFMKGSMLKHNDILITKTGRVNTENSSLGRSALFEGEDDTANINGHVYLVRLNEGMCPRFVLSILLSSSFHDLIRKVCVGAIDKRQLNLTHIENFPIITPPLELQEKFVAKIELIEKQKEVVETSICELETLLGFRMDYWFN